jgi:hypothetical protein
MQQPVPDLDEEMPQDIPLVKPLPIHHPHNNRGRWKSSWIWRIWYVMTAYVRKAYDSVKNIIHFGRYAPYTSACHSYR